jgi:dihydrofolate synthase / folylpolyglutamate synthase
MRELMVRLGSPHGRLGAVIHVAGTNGKGSTVAMLGAIARAAGLRTASYTSPHLSTLRERIVVDDDMISESDFVMHYDEVAAVGGEQFTFFEQVTAIALSYFATKRVQLTVLEVGLGGRLDATNIVDADVAVVTGVDLDHQAVLGDTLQQIAYEKAGVFKAGRSAVIGCSGAATAVPHLLAHARARGCSGISLLDASEIASLPDVALVGRHQRYNAASAVAAMQSLAVQRPELPNVARSAISAGLRQVKHPGRFEQIAGKPRVILDGAHNVAGAKALAAALQSEPEFDRSATVLIVAVSADKDAVSLMRELVPAVNRVMVTRYQQDRSMPVAALRDSLRGLWFDDEIGQADTFAAAVAVARGFHDVQTIVVAGSLFLVGEARTLLCRAASDRFLVSDPAAGAAPGTAIKGSSS